MKKKTIYKIIIAIILAVLIIISSNSTFAITPKDIKGSDIEIKELSFLDNMTELVRFVGTFIAVGVLMVIGIKYIMGSVEERASYKKSMVPYIIGCIILFGAANIAPSIKDIFTDMGEDTEDIGNSILGLIRVIGTFISVGALMVMGIKYMMGSTEERASYKKSMVPYIIGCIVLFGAVNITSMIYNVVPKDSTTSTRGGGGKTQLIEQSRDHRIN